MSNVHGLFSSRKSESDEEEDSGNNRYVGGVDSRGGGSGLAVEPNPDVNPSESIFNLASHATAEEAAASASGGEAQRRTITMYRDGFTVDDGPYRRLDDPANADFLSSLARGITPRELEKNGNENVTVGLVDKRGEDYVETFRSFSGVGTSLGSASATGDSSAGGVDGVIYPDERSGVESVAVAGVGGKTTSIQVRLLSGKRMVAKVPVAASVQVLVNEIHASGEAGSDPYVLMAGFPPRQVTDLNATIEKSGLAGSSVTQKKYIG